MGQINEILILILIHTVGWPKAATYQYVCNACKTYIIKHYYASATVVFDGYDGLPSTESEEQNRRAKNRTSVYIVVRPDLPTVTSQCAFLGNNHSKSLLIQTLRRGKMKALKLALKKDATMLSYMDVFIRITSNHEYVATAGEQFLFKLYVAEQFATQNKFSHVAYNVQWLVHQQVIPSRRLVFHPPLHQPCMQHT